MSKKIQSTFTVQADHSKQLKQCQIENAQLQHDISILRAQLWREIARLDGVTQKANSLEEEMRRARCAIKAKDDRIAVLERDGVSPEEYKLLADSYDRLQQKGKKDKDVFNAWMQWLVDHGIKTRSRNELPTTSPTTPRKQGQLLVVPSSSPLTTPVHAATQPRAVVEDDDTVVGSPVTSQSRDVCNLSLAIKRERRSSTVAAAVRNDMSDTLYSPQYESLDLAQIVMASSPGKRKQEPLSERCINESSQSDVSQPSLPSPTEGRMKRARVTGSSGKELPMQPSGDTSTASSRAKLARKPVLSPEVEHDNKNRGRYSRSRKSDVSMADYGIDKEQVGVNFAFADVVRSKAERRKLHGQDCPCCRRFYEIAGPPDPVMAIQWRDSGMQGSGVVEAIQQAKQDYSRHRHLFPRPKTPPGFWDGDFPSTQQEAEYRRLAEEQRRQMIREREESARRGGVYVLRDMNG